ncbi:MAG TPA: winged helix-turn-helix domain-containing protein, partial [Blastocatellia bacterium]
MPSKAFETLLVLIQHNEAVVSKEDLMRSLWPDSFVEESNLSQNIFLLRKALGETAQDHRYIITIPGRGYRFAETVRLVMAGESNLVGERHSHPSVTVEEIGLRSPANNTLPSLKGLRRRPWSWILLSTAGGAVLVGGLVFLVRTRQTPGLKQEDQILVSDFVNTTGEPIFDGA